MSVGAGIRIRTARPDEFDALRTVAVAAFGDESIGVLLDLLRGSWCWVDDLVLVAESDVGDDLVGCVVLTGAVLDSPDRLVDVLVLSPLAVTERHRGGGVGQALVHAALDAAVSRPEPLVFLEGSPTYYARCGFVPATPLGFRSPSVRIPDAAFQVWPAETAGRELSGRLVYPDAFWRTDSVGLRGGPAEPGAENGDQRGRPSFAWRGAFTGGEANSLHAAAFDTRVFSDEEWDWVGLTERHSLGWVTVRLDGELVGFANVISDGFVHAWLQDVMVAPSLQGHGIGVEMVRAAVDGARVAGCEWLHVDFDADLAPFYLDACGFEPTSAGLIDLTVPAG